MEREVPFYFFSTQYPPPPEAVSTQQVNPVGVLVSGTVTLSPETVQACTIADPPSRFMQEYAVHAAAGVGLGVDNAATKLSNQNANIPE